MSGKLALDMTSLDLSVAGEACAEHIGKAVNIDPDHVERDLARLVLCLIEFLRQLMEMQAVRRMEAGTLTEEEEERLGLTLMRARGRVVELAEQFGLGEDDLKLHLGALGRLV